MVDAQWFIQLASIGDLLGNENHLVLLLENLLKNAQFFSTRRGYKVPFSPVALTLTEDDGYAHLSVYNRGPRSEEHTSELQSRGHLVCRLLLDKKKKIACTRPISDQK